MRIVWIATDCLLFRVVHRLFDELSQRASSERKQLAFRRAEFVVLFLIGLTVSQWHHICISFWILFLIAPVRYLSYQLVHLNISQWQSKDESANVRNAISPTSSSWHMSTRRTSRNPDGRAEQVECIFGIPKTDLLRRPLHKSI
ncbi:hypothetical protein M514_11804 [Trichuris suis]|uniref:Uncharacterized protein n=1 Tax=Trichuris suis TaxID=68888 RepID=A0A085LQP8_9BILA|nr:hypothetical protein M513_11804 [Trichuris suis]KFD64520.1 hypothetical protein M514_11804 [Trichuris suis]KHJ40167.1 hypothetical protein D918_09767 [Trichuris suis]